MNAKPMNQSADDDMPAEIDFSKGTRGKFYRPDAKFVLPVHLEASVANALTRSAQAEGVELNAFVVKLLEEHGGAVADSQ